MDVRFSSHGRNQDDEFHLFEAEAERTAESESQSDFPLFTATGGGAKSEWVGHLEATLFGRAYTAIFLSNTLSAVMLSEIGREHYS